MINKLILLLNKKDKRKFGFLILFSIVISLIETIGISVIMPFISIATDFETIHDNKYYSTVYEYFSFNSEVKFIIAFGVLLVAFYFFRSIINLTYFYLLNKFTYSRYHFLAYQLFKNYMGLPYKEFTKKNSSSMTKSIVTEAVNLTSLISALLLMISEVFIILFIYAILLYVNYKITLLLTLFLIINALIMVKFVSKKIKLVGKTRAEIQSGFFEIINKSFANFKIIKLQAHYDSLLNDFNIQSSKYSKVNIQSSTLSIVPKLFLESISFIIIIVIIIYYIWDSGTDTTNIMGTISVFVLGLYRLMPSLNRIMTSYNIIMYQHTSLDIVHKELLYDYEKLGSEKLSFNDLIKLQNIYFEYVPGKPVLKDINLEIKQGSSTAFIGESGSGKSTLIDIIIGLYKPKNGTIRVDGKIVNDNNIRCLRLKIGYIPQHVYLFDGTVAENIAFDIDYDLKKVNDCLKKANIYEFLKTKEGHNTFVGEGGIMLSGGQKQRIAIARALYSEPEILVLDEATSALDDKIEEKIMNEIYEISKNKTLIIIAHRLSTIRNCQNIYSVNKGILKAVNKEDLNL